MGLHFALPGLNWAIPVGISFFTFQAVGYFLDVYHGRTKAERNLLDYVLFVSFFPQVTSGPISKADELLPQIKIPHTFSFRNFVTCMPMSDKGYLPLQGKMSKEPEKKERSTQVLDSLKQTYIRAIASDAKSRGIQFVFVASPKYGADHSSVQPVKDIASELGIPFFDYMDKPAFQKWEYFKEPMHMNDDGARKFTAEIIKRIIEL